MQDTKPVWLCCSNDALEQTANHHQAALYLAVGHGSNTVRVSSCFTCTQTSRCRGSTHLEEAKDCQGLAMAHSVIKRQG